MVRHEMRDDGLLVTTASGEVTYDQLLAHLRAHVEEPDLPAGSRELVLLADVTSVRLDAEEIGALVEFERGHLRWFEGAQVAVVAPRDLHFGLSRMYEGIAAADEARLRVFRSEADAREWLGVD